MKERPLESLQKQYESPWSKPTELFRIRNTDRFFDLGEDSENPKLEIVNINREKIRKAIGNLKNGAAPRPDGITVEILKLFCD